MRVHLSLLPWPGIIRNGGPLLVRLRRDDVSELLLPGDLVLISVGVVLELLHKLTYAVVAVVHCRFPSDHANLH